MQPMEQFDPDRPCRMHDRVNDRGLGDTIWICIIVPLAALAVGSGVWDLGFACTVGMLGVPILLAERYPGWER
jgi:hypothetical protein